MLSGFTLVRNAVKLEYPIVPAIRSILPICDEVIVNVGKSDDGTRNLIEAIGDSRIQIQDSVWDFSRAGATLSAETNRAMAACRGSWGVYIQADEVLHETGAAMLADAVRRFDQDERVEGLLVDYLHFYGNVHTVATNRHWYRREVRAVRLRKGAEEIRSYGDAQGFRVGTARRRVRARPTGARMFHYGWARNAVTLAEKHGAFRELFTEHVDKLERRQAVPGLEWTPLLRRFTGSHPAVARDWIAARDGAAPGHAIGPWRLRVADLRYYLSDWIERSTGVRVFEYRNYVVV